MINKKLQSILKKIDSTAEYELYDIMKIKGRPFVDTPGNFREEYNDYGDDIELYYQQNMGKKDYKKLLRWIRKHPKQIKLLMRTH
jgi:hypothetical protein